MTADGIVHAWHWSQWELVGVQESDAAIIVDAVEVPADGLRSGTLLTLAVSPATADSDRLAHVGQTLASWVESEAVCDVLYQPADLFPALVMFQDSEVLVLTAVA